MRLVAVGGVALGFLLASCGGSGSTTTVTRTVTRTVPAPSATRTLTGHNFGTPSRNIECEYFFRALRCDIGSGLRPSPPKSGCHSENGFEAGWTGLRISKTGAAMPACSGDAVDVGPPVPYGSMWKRGDDTCLSRRAGLTCLSRVGHGFFLSRDRWVTF